MNYKAYNFTLTTEDHGTTFYQIISRWGDWLEYFIKFLLENKYLNN